MNVNTRFVRLFIQNNFFISTLSTRFKNSFVYSMARYILYVKAASDQKSMGDCPFSQRAYMYAKLKMTPDMYELKPIDLSNKTEEFMKLNPDGKVPVLIDRHKDNKIVTDSAEITKYIDSQISEPYCKIDYNGPAVEACSSMFGKFAAFMKNKDDSKTESLKEELVNELRKINDYLKSPTHDGKFLLGDTLSEIDCMVLPRLRHVAVSGSHHKGFQIPDEFVALKQYIANGENDQVFKDTSCKPEEIIKGWAKHM
ncbi:hypothetical protein KUTeg_021164 [Tegillarca granosa]|uniref:Glutathione S-transferase n=1 Tax=Tegillarca granosa TaxID=220873 RepID=A0ABQ9EE38_TEGGR|nr:hypothetical protein KUTeg_021164 [Tegillarca granosa]